MLGWHFFHDLFRSYVVVFGNLFNDIKVHRYDNNRNRIQTLAVPLEYGPRQKTLTRILRNPDLNQPTTTIVPCMSYDITDIRRNPNLQLNKLEKLSRQTSDKDKFLTQYQCVPYQIDFRLSIYVKYAYDGFQIVEQILPFFAPEFSVTANPLRMFEYDMDYAEDLKIVLNHCAPDDNVYSGEFADNRVIIWNLDFTMNVPLYGPVDKVGIIKKAITNFYLPPTSAGSPIVSNTDIINTPPAITHTVQPGLTIDGKPTANVSESIHYSLIKADDNWAYAETWTDNITGTTAFSGEFRPTPQAAEIISTQMATTNLLADGVASQVKVQEIKTHGNSIEIDIRKGEYIILQLEHTINDLRLTHWPKGYLTKVTLEIRNTGAFTVNSWSNALWDQGNIPSVTPGAGKKDIFLFHSGDGGQTIFGSIIGQDFT